VLVRLRLLGYVAIDGRARFGGTVTYDDETARLRVASFGARAIVMVALVIAVSAPFATSASARGQTLRPGDKYVALGSSFASGPAIPDPADTSTCLRSTHNYSHLVAAKLKLALTDATCGAATTDNVLTTPQGTNPPQIDAVTPDAKLITITIGGNDVNYTVSNLGCAASGAKGQNCVGNGVNPQDIAAALAALPGKMANMFGAIKDKAPKARVIVLPYPRVLPSSATPCPPSAPMQPTDMKFLVDFGDKLHTIIKQSAATAKVDYVETYTPTGHDACAAPARRWIEGQTPASAAFPFHPNGAGMSAQAKLILKRLQS